MAKFNKSGNALKIIPLGGCEEVGKNMTVFEYGNDIVILDMGLMFPEEDMPGIDYVIPNAEYLKGKEKNIRAVVFSHGHLDHIGAAPILLQKLGNPQIIGRPLTLEMVKHRVEDLYHGASKKLKTTYVKSIDETFNLGSFTLKFFQIDHSVMDAVGIILETPSSVACLTTFSNVSFLTTAMQRVMFLEEIIFFFCETKESATSVLLADEIE